ncbi:MAG TPA: hypothetical protein ENH94_11660 [Phycisphaerales bacterium]|nr:hypothetical protein [Phycisphaerales bacterium]
MTDKERPIRVTVLAWIWILIGLATIVNGTKSFVTTMRLAEFLATQDDPEAINTVLDLVGPFLTPPLELAILLMIGVCVIIFGVGMLRLRPWARFLAEITAWIFVFNTASNGMLQAVSFIRLTSQFDDGAGGDVLSFLQVFLVVGVIMRIGIAIVLLCFVRSRKVKDAFSIQPMAAADLER